MWETDPVDFVRVVLGAEPEPWQAEALEAIARNDRVAVRSGHGVGKTTFLAWLIFWFGLTREDAKIGITAPAAPQLEANLWPELHKWRRAMNDNGFGLFANGMRISSDAVNFEGGNLAVARTARPDQPEALQGLHATNLLFLIDEASGVPEIVYEAAMGSLSTPGAKQVLCGNPTRPSGYFYNAFTALRDRWWTRRVSSAEVERARGHIADVIATYGRDSNAYRVRVDGDFPSSADEQVVPLDLIEAAIKRKVEPSNAFFPVWGLDVARFGDDRTALAKRQGNRMPEPIKAWRGKDLMQVAGLVMEEWRLTDARDRPKEILVDVIGIGAGVVDRLRELGLPVRGVNVAESPAASERFMRLRDELWWKAREWFAGRDVSMVEDKALIGELTAPTYAFTSSGKLVVESKDDLKKRGVASPDLADAFCLTLAGGLDRKEESELDRYRRKERRRGSWMSA